MLILFAQHIIVTAISIIDVFPFRMLEDFDMEVVLRQNFYDFFAEHRYNSEDNELLYRMEAFDKKTVSDSDINYWRGGV